jgi:hydroxymethylglutaryl-CoA lyase
MSIELVEVPPATACRTSRARSPTEDKLELIRRAISAGARRLEVASFVHPGKVPQMADAEAVVAGLPRGAARYVGLVLNKRGALRALETAIDEIGIVCAASDTFGTRNQGMDAEAIAGDGLRSPALLPRARPPRAGDYRGGLRLSV